MQINCPKCQKPIELMETISFREAEESGVEKTQIAQGVFCPDCGLIPFEFQSPVRSNKSIVPPEELISHFRLLKPLGQGGFGVVWLAKDVNLDRLVALKMPFTNKSSVADLLHEAQSAAKLRHPNIVSVFETGQTEQGQAFIASEYIEGLNLKDVLSAGRPTLETAIELMVTISDALHHAHQYGIIHRDVKPANIMIDREGIPYVADFGLAKRVSEESESSKGSIVGTAHYMSPEQAAGATDLAEGVYDFVSPLHDIRSGRFDTLNDRGYVPADPAVDGALLVADFRRVGRDVYYRFYNSGETPIEIHLTNKADTAPTDDSKKLAQDLNPDQSIDVYIKTSNQYAVWVKSATTDKAIQGIYDFIDSE